MITSQSDLRLPIFPPKNYLNSFTMFLSQNAKNLARVSRFFECKIISCARQSLIIIYGISFNFFLRLLRIGGFIYNIQRIFFSCNFMIWWNNQSMTYVCHWSWIDHESNWLIGLGSLYENLIFRVCFSYRWCVNKIPITWGTIFYILIHLINSCN